MYQMNAGRAEAGLEDDVGEELRDVGRAGAEEDVDQRGRRWARNTSAAQGRGQVRPA